MSKLLIPVELKSMVGITKLVEGVYTQGYVSLCHTLFQDCDMAARCRGCLLNYYNSPVDTQGKDNAIQFLYDNNLITKAQALQFTLDFN